MIMMFKVVRVSKNGPYQKWLLHCGESCVLLQAPQEMQRVWTWEQHWPDKTTFPETWKCKDPPELQIKAMDGDTPLLIHVQVYLARSNRIYIAHLFLLSQWFTRTWTLPICLRATWKPPKEKTKRGSTLLGKRFWNVMKHPQWYPVAQEAVDAALRTLNLPIREVVHLSCWRSVGWWRGRDKRIMKRMRIKQEWDMRVFAYIILRQHHSFYGKRMITSHPYFVFFCSW